MKGIIGHHSCDLDVKGSRFLAESFPVATQDEARALVKSQKEKYADSTHVVHAFVIGPTGGILGCSDDGEPSGTAGRPALEVLKGSGITGILVTVTRWFGGTLLGTGGLVKAYGDSVKAVLTVTPSHELVTVRDYAVTVAYELHDRVRHDIDLQRIAVTSEDFDVDVTIRGCIPDAESAAFCARIVTLTNGKNRASLSDETRVVPLGPVPSLLNHLK